VIYRVELHRPAARELKRLDRSTVKRIEAKITDLAQAPLDPRLSKQMETDPGPTRSPPVQTNGNGPGSPLFPGRRLANHLPDQ